MSVADAAGYVAAAYGAILVGLIVMYALAARRLSGISRQVRALKAAVEARRAAPTPAAMEPAAPPAATESAAPPAERDG